MAYCRFFYGGFHFTESFFFVGDSVVVSKLHIILLQLFHFCLDTVLTSLVYLRGGGDAVNFSMTY